MSNSKKTTTVEIAENAKLPTVTLHNGVPTVSSLEIADIFSKEHKHIREAIKNLELPDDFRQPNFRPSSYQNQQNKKQPCFNITQDGFTVLAMGFTGKKAMEFKLAYIAKFNEMQNELKEVELKAIENNKITGNSNKQIGELTDIVGKLTQTVSSLQRKQENVPTIDGIECTEKQLEKSYDDKYLAEKSNVSSHVLKKTLLLWEIITITPNKSVKLGIKFREKGLAIDIPYKVNGTLRTKLRWTDKGVNGIYSIFKETKGLIKKRLQMLKDDDIFQIIHGEQ